MPPLESLSNFRDLGGLKNREGKAVKPGLIFRSDELSRLTDADLQALAAIPLRTIVDLRTPMEIDRKPDRRPDSLRNMVVCTLDTPRCMTAIADQQDDASLEKVSPIFRRMLNDTDAKISTLSEERIRMTMASLYEQMTVEPDFIEVYRQIFALLMRDDAVPLLFHCMAGKDRTGIVAALILAALDVDEATIVADYMLSDVVIHTRYAKPVAADPPLRYLYGTSEEYIEASLAKIRRDHGTAANYLRDVIHADLAGLRARYLE